MINKYIEKTAIPMSKNIIFHNTLIKHLNINKLIHIKMYVF